MGEYISFSQGLLVTIVSMVAVFIVLILIAFLISGLQAISMDKSEKNHTNKNEVIKTTEPNVSETTNEITEELVAIIAAAVAMNLGMDIPDINIRSIKRIPDRTSTWSNVGNIEQVFGRL